MFAAGGLFLSMVATTMWISGDVARMRQEEQAKQAERCALAASQNSKTPANMAPVDGFPQPAAEQPDDGCPTKPDAAAAGGTAAVDPVTGEPLAPSSGSVDPVTGQPIASTTGAVDPTGAQSVDPATGQPVPSGDVGFVQGQESSVPVAVDSDIDGF